MDYKELLRKFVQAACDAEGVHPNYFAAWASDETEFTEEEIKELERLDCDSGE